MRTVILNEPGKLALIDRPAPHDPGPGEVLIKIRRVGVCGTDMHAFRGKQPFFTYPRVLGHELGVEVAQTGPGVTRLRAGDKCCVEPYLHCGKCIACRRGKTNCCTQMRVLGVHVDGGYCDYIVLPEAKLFPSAKLSFDELALVETLGIGAHAVDRAQLDPGETVLVIGVGPIGLSVVQFAQAAGAKVIVMDANPNRLEICRTQFPVEHLITADDKTLDTLKQITHNDLPTAVFDATGNPKSMAASFSYVSHGGKLIFVGLFPGDVSFHDPDFHKREMTLYASRNSRPADFQRIIALVESGKVNTAPWVTHRATLEKVPDVFAGWLEPDAKVLKAMIQTEV
jgi:2-desacetyl-2-hydroxyethyl bacteriochlorophyllide A dehydrogenase